MRILISAICFLSIWAYSVEAQCSCCKQPDPCDKPFKDLKDKSLSKTADLRTFLDAICHINFANYNCTTQLLGFAGAYVEHSQRYKYPEGFANLGATCETNPDCEMLIVWILKTLQKTDVDCVCMFFDSVCTAVSRNDTFLRTCEKDIFSLIRGYRERKLANRGGFFGFLSRSKRAGADKFYSESCGWTGQGFRPLSQEWTLLEKKGVERFKNDTR